VEEADMARATRKISSSKQKRGGAKNIGGTHQRKGSAKKRMSGMSWTSGRKQSVKAKSGRNA